jgi:hypothetical protein
MTLPSWDDDEALLADFRAAMTQSPPVPPDFTAAARASLAWRTIDADLFLAELAFDSSHHEELATRSGPESSGRLLVFDGAGYRVEAEISDDGIVGQITPADSGRVSCQTATGTHDETSLDELGCFELKVPPRGPVRLHMEADGRTVATAWVNLA